MNRNFQKYPGLSEAGVREADSRQTSPAVWVACHMAESEGRIGSEIWYDPTETEVEHISMMMNEWAIHGDIEPGIYHWGCGANIEVKAE